ICNWPSGWRIIYFSEYHLTFHKQSGKDCHTTQYITNFVLHWVLPNNPGIDEYHNQDRTTSIFDINNLVFHIHAPIFEEIFERYNPCYFASQTYLQLSILHSSYS